MQRDVIHNYLKTLAKYLARLDKADADEVVKEIESHIYDVIESKEAQGEPVDARAILEGFGQPRELAAQYADHVLQGTPPPAGFKAIQSVKKGITRGVYYSMAVFGFGTSFFLVALGLGKVLMPSKIGLWSVSQGNSIIISFTEFPHPQSQEPFGFWLAPLSIGLGVALAWLTIRVLTVLKQNILKPKA